jgi:hypothetical protein
VVDFSTKVHLLLKVDRIMVPRTMKKNNDSGNNEARRWKAKTKLCLKLCNKEDYDPLAKYLPKK